eukprot:scaffold1982_cov93-Amphora_coffeaeformis.AAC.11
MQWRDIHANDRTTTEKGSLAICSARDNGHQCYKFPPENSFSFAFSISNDIVFQRTFFTEESEQRTTSGTLHLTLDESKLVGKIERTHVQHNFSPVSFTMTGMQEESDAEDNKFNIDECNLYKVEVITLDHAGWDDSVALTSTPM